MPGLIAGYHELRAYARTASANESHVERKSTVPFAAVRLEEKCTRKKVKENNELSENSVGSVSVMIPGKLAFKLYDTYGLEEDVIIELAKVEGFQVDVNGFRHLLNVAKVQSKESFRSEAESEQMQQIFNQLVKLGLNFTQDTMKYSYTKENDKYVFPSVKCEVKAIIVNGKAVSRIGPGIQCSVVLDQTNFYHEAGGQSSDTGQLAMKDGTRFHVTDVINHGGYLLHHGYVNKEGNLQIIVIFKLFTIFIFILHQFFYDKTFSILFLPPTIASLISVCSFPIFFCMSSFAWSFYLGLDPLSGYLLNNFVVSAFMLSKKSYCCLA
jgi:alanyl-tRNA synthetase